MMRYVLLIIAVSLLASCGEPKICTADYNPVCGVDGVTYSNLCTAGDMEIAFEGECEHVCSDEEKAHQACTREYRPVCADGRTFGNGCTACAAGVDSYEQGECPAHVCTAEEKQAEICTMQYDPVCGDDGKTYGNACQACGSGKIDSWTQGEC